ncbi:hypothetical protein N7456_006230 [Penicillium angulare]|uniref:Serine/arginine repetitive matrix protein 1 n=1 Tax=Penicillium angulare TaxID=116970 RepID=A0A9W9FH80_9EURO|nr:hypothetical protein N7456_006230 [Penicillium angulare]
MTGEAGKVIALLTDQVDHHHEDTMREIIETGAHHLEIDLAYAPTHGYHLAEVMDGQGVALPTIAVVPGRLPFRAEATGLHHTRDGDPPLDVSHHEETTDQGLLHLHGDRSLHIVRVDPATYLGAAEAQGATGMYRLEARTQASTSKIQHNPPPIRPSSPSQNVPRREPAVDVNRSLPYSRARQLSPSRTSRPESSSTSRRSSPSGGPERGGQTPLKNRSRSPSHFSPAHRFSAPSGNITPQDRGFTHDTEGKDSTRIYGNTDRLESDSTEPNQRRFGANPPTQPRSLGLRQSPPSGPSQGPRKIPSQPRGSQNYPFLSAPTRPRRGPSSRDGPWPSGTMSRRGPPTTPSQTPPSGPRASFSSGFPGGSNFRHPGSRQNSTVPASPSLPTPKAPNHLAGLCTVIPGGKLLPPVLDGVSEKRLSQLEADQEKLVEQMAEVQRSKRAVLRDWDRLDHESSICALKSELAEGHLQRMADETIGGGIPF